MTDPATVADQYATSERLRTRMAVWRPGPDGVSPLREVRRVLRPGGTLVAVTNGAAHLAALPGQFRPRPGGRSADLRRAT